MPYEDPACAYCPKEIQACRKGDDLRHGPGWCPSKVSGSALEEGRTRYEDPFVARAALYGRRESHMKDLPALLCAVLSVRSPGLLAEVFDRVIDTPRMLRNFVQIMRSGVVGRVSLGTLPKRCVRQWLESRSDAALFVSPKKLLVHRYSDVCSGYWD